MKNTYVKGLDIVNRYKKNYSISEESLITKEMVLQHWDLERKLTKELLASTRESRWEVFEKSYTTLYHELAWLNKLVHEKINTSLKLRYSRWVDAIGPSPKKIYEIGSGKG